VRRAAIALLLLAGAARGETRTYVLAVANNAPPADADGERLEPLRYADDDAADFFTFTRELAREAFLLTVLDAPSQRRFPDLAAVARAPTMAELRRAVAALRERFAADLRDGHEPVLFFFFSGHGTRGGRRPPSLTLLDEPLTQQVLYEEVLAQLPARYVHLFVDACHAEAVVRPRDVSAQAVDVTDEDVQTYAARATLQRFPQVGAILATASGVQAHEWDVYQRGVFSHELLSALRGAADVNGDGRIEYSEVSAFLGAANREVADPRARLSVVVRPPALNRRAAIVDTAGLRGAFRLVGRGGALGGVFVEDDLGNRIADFHAEPGQRVSVALPSDRKVFVRHRRGEAPVRAPAGATVSLEGLRFAEAGLTARGAIDSSLERGLFAAAYGPRYYRGYVDQNQELSPVPVREELAPEPVVRQPPAPAAPPPRSGARSGWALLGTAGGLALAAGVLAGLAADAVARFHATPFERPAAELRDQAIGFESAAWVAAGVALAAAGAGTWLLSRSRARPVTLGIAPNGAGLLTRIEW
jgi:Caspase domain